MKRMRIPALVGLTLVLAFCNKPNNEASSAVIEHAAPAVDSTPQPFQPPSDGLLKPEQVKRFLLAHQALLKLNDLYLDSLAAARGARKRSVLSALDLAQDKAARKFGLNGYAEYRWILEDAPRNPENARLLRQMQVSVVSGG